MEIHTDLTRTWLEQPGDFKAFKLVARGRPSDWPLAARALAGVARFDSAERAWVSQAGLCALRAQGVDAAWLDSLRAMVEKARPHGWVDEASGDIRAHVEWR